MSKTTAPLLSWGASGQIAKTQVYSTWKGRPYVRRYVIPTNPNSPAQQLTRNTFRFLTRLWQFLPAGALGAWNLYGDNSRFTARNGWLKLNNGVLRTETDLELMTISPSAGGGIVAAGMVATAGSEQITVTLTAPGLPTGWTITAAWAMAIRNVDPQTSEIYDVAADTDASAPYEIILTGLTASEEYVVGGWFEFVKADGGTAYGVALLDTATPTA